MDPPEHTHYRKLIDPYFSAKRIAVFRSQCVAIADELVTKALQHNQVELMADLAEPFASRIQCAFMGWPLELQDSLLYWIKRNNRAVLAADKVALSALATEFKALITKQLKEHRHIKKGPDINVTGMLLHEQVGHRPLNDHEITSILRNWTVGEVGTIATSVGILAHFLACHPDIQQHLRKKPELLWLANDEILRMHNPLVDSRRFTTREVELSDRKIPAGQRITINWVAANRDPEIFPKPDEFSLKRELDKNLLYGAGIHVCPGKPLARMELVVIIQSLLQQSNQLQLMKDRPPVLARYPASGYANLPLGIY